jgi:hypothetical protein
VLNVAGPRASESCGEFETVDRGERLEPGSDLGDRGDEQAPVGVLLAVLGYTLGTYGGWLTGQLMRLVTS